VEFANPECRFEYRKSRFKTADKDRFIITEVRFRLTRFGKPRLRYGELQQYVEQNIHLEKLTGGRAALNAVRSAVLALRKRKSMVIDPADPNSRSVGSFFINPILSQQTCAALQEQWKESGHEIPIPVFPADGGVKLPAAWLVENAGFTRGYRRGGAGISDNHSLALINCGGTTRDLLGLASDIETAVYRKFNIRLEREAVVVE
jgi:UDP-N-acetylmuramate dehydrogenase